MCSLFRLSRDYFKEKSLKLAQQLKANRDGIFSGTFIYVDGWTDPPMDEIKRIVCDGGGKFDYHYNSSITHVIAENLSDATSRQIGSKAIRAQWIVDSVKEQRLLPTIGYRLSIEQGNVLSFGSNQPVEINCRDDPAQFLKRYFDRSRLHLISTLPMKLSEKIAEKYPPSLSNGRGECIAHLDMDCFFVSVYLRSHPEYKGKPVAVGSSSMSSSTADLASVSYEARKFGVRNGMWCATAKELCPDLVVVDYPYKEIEEVSEMFHMCCAEVPNVVMEIASIDECVLDISDVGADMVDGLRTRIMDITGCPCSAGIGPNRFLARMALKQAKPNGIQRLNGVDTIQDMPISDLPTIGYSLSAKLANMGVNVLSDLTVTDFKQIETVVGTVMANRLVGFAMGTDNRPVLDSRMQKRKSMSVEVNWGIRFYTQNHVYGFIIELVKEAVSRLKDRTAGSVVFKLKTRHPDAPLEPKKYLGCGLCTSISRSKQISSTALNVVTRTVLEIYGGMDANPVEIRGVGIQFDKIGSGISGSNSNNSITKWTKRGRNVLIDDTSNLEKKKPRRKVERVYAPRQVTLTQMDPLMSSVKGRRNHEGGLNIAAVVPERESNELDLDTFPDIVVQWTRETSLFEAHERAAVVVMLRELVIHKRLDLARETLLMLRRESPEVAFNEILNFFQEYICVPIYGGKMGL